jgi:predicted Zn finger-like uncharacterized protein
MRIDCPACSASYDVPDAMLVGRKAVRCARCGEQWTPSASGAGHPPAEAAPAADAAPREGAPGAAAPAEPAPPAPTPPDPAPPEPAPPAPMAPPAAAAPPRLPGRLPPGHSAGLRLAWVLSLLVVIGALAAAAVWRGPIMRAWPPSMRVYAALGMVHTHPGR